MPHIKLEEHLPGVTGPLEYRKDTAEPIRNLTQILMKGPSTLSEGEREMIASIVSHGNECRFCTAAHATLAGRLLKDEALVEAVLCDIDSAPVSEKMKALLTIASKVQQNGKLVTEDLVSRAKAAGSTDLEIHDTVLIAALFSLYNRYVDGLATHMPKDSSYFQTLAERLSTQGYVRNPEAYETLKQAQTQTGQRI